MCLSVKPPKVGKVNQLKKKYQIFISSTYSDLVEERKYVLDAILNMHQFPIGMEQFSANDTEQWEVIKEAIDTSDYYILILGKRYGSIITTGEDTGISYTEKEFRYAKNNGVPILAFIKSDNASYKGTDFESDAEKTQKLNAFISEVKTGRVVKWFNNPYQLQSQVAFALHDEMEKGDRPGWIRGDEVQRLISNVNDEWDPFKPVEEYEFEHHQTPADGKHKQIGRNGDTVAEGDWKDGKLIAGIEYDWLIKVTRGKLIFKPDCPEDPYDVTDNFEYEKHEQYGWEMPFPFSWSEPEIEHEGLEQFYVVDMHVTEKTEKMFNIRKLEDFLNEKNPEHLKYLKELIAIESGDDEDE